MRRVGPRVYPRAGGGTCRNRATAVIRTGLSPRRQGTAIHEIERGGRQGLSPRRRGNRSPAQPARAPRGSIPAQAGEPTTHSPATPAGRVYPRAGGGTSQVIRTARGNPGLSPRRRGNPAPRRSRPAPEWVYPRAGGGTACKRHHLVLVEGLSPRRRGNLVDDVRGDLAQGSIPAQAGEPCCRQRMRTSIWVYPRAGGGTRSSLLGNFSLLGLSPRRRGNRHERRSVGGVPGSIPAQAGEPRSGRRRRSPRRVYPRAGGGTRKMTGPTSLRTGLSPRRRGNPRCRGRPPARHGSIPAQAGEPIWKSGSGGRSGVYPRAGGGTNRGMVVGESEGGLSPRRRGNLDVRRLRLPGLGSIPAQAGEPVALALLERAARVGDHLGSIPAQAGEPLLREPRRGERGVYPRAGGGTRTVT